MKTGAWDADDPKLVINKVKALVETISPDEIRKDDDRWRLEILWLWYHHAISWDAITKKCDRQLAQHYADQARLNQHPDHENQITMLLWYLVYDRVDEAKRWHGRMLDPTERETATYLIEEYQAGKFFDPARRAAR